jgi:hypothetical protein
MIEPNDVQKNSAVRRMSELLIANALVMTLMCELYTLCGYFSLMSVLMVFSPGSLETWRLVATGIHMLAAVLYFAAICGAALYFLRIVSCKSLVKWLLIILSIICISSLPIALYQGLDDSDMVRWLYYLEGLSVLLIVNTLAAFHDKGFRGVKSGFRGNQT